jgi:hypothetical protein
MCCGVVFTRLHPAALFMSVTVTNIPVGGKGRGGKKVRRIEGLRRLGKVADRQYIGQIGYSLAMLAMAARKNLNCWDTDKGASRMNKDKNGSGNVDAS